MDQMNVSRRSFLRTAAGASATIGGTEAWGQSNQPARPNILLLITDQQHWKMMSAAGNRWLKTPAMDGLVHSGVRFERAFSANPVCMPSRFSMFTGKYPSAVGIRANETAPDPSVDSFAPRALGNLVRSGGYETVFGGKVHLPGVMKDVKKAGFDRILTTNEREGLADECVKYLHEPHSKPFLMVGSFINPHDICYMAIRDYALSPEGKAEAARNAAAQAADGRGGRGGDLLLANNVPPELDEALKLPAGVSEAEFYAKHCPPVPPNFDIPAEEPDGIDWLAKLRHFRQHARTAWSPEKWRLHRWAYARLTERVDSQLNQVLNALKETGLDKNTVVLWTSDHGDHDSAHRLEHKSTHYEESVRIPLVMRAPDQKKAGVTVSDALVCNGLDILPTLCDYAGVKPPSDLQGKSLRPFLQGRSFHLRDTVFSETEMGYMVADRRYKYCAFDPDKSPKRRDSLVDLQVDPGEMTNLVRKPEHAATVKRLRAAMADWMKQNKIQFEMPA